MTEVFFLYFQHQNYKLKKQVLSNNYSDFRILNYYHSKDLLTLHVNIF